MTKKYKIEFDWWEAVLEIKDDEKTTGHMKDQLLFFIESKNVSDKKEDIIQAYIEQTAPWLVKESMEWNKDGVIHQFAEGMYEGFLPINGDFGVTLVSIDNWEFPGDEFSVNAVK